jgi:hypothetical protein
MDSSDVLIDFDDLLNAFDVLKVCAAAVPFPDVLELGRRNDIEGHTGMLAAPDHARSGSRCGHVRASGFR